MGRFTDKLHEEQAIEDSLSLAQSKMDSTHLALEQIKIEKAKADSTAEANIGKIPEEERADMIPIVKLAKAIRDNPYVDYLRGGHAQAVYSTGATALNIMGIPLNYWSKWLTGYNPGFSGERVMNRLMGIGEGSISEGWAGLGGEHIWPGPLTEQDPDEAWGTPAPEGKGKWLSGEWLWETAEREAKEKAAETKKNKGK